jgi:FxsC-like protein
MYALLKLNYFRDAYELAVHRLAQRIVEVARLTMIPLGYREDFLGRASAFDDSEPGRRLRIAVLACDSGRLPPGRSRDSYGDSSLDWQPYHRESSRPLVQHAGRIARQLGFHPSIHEFEEEAESVLQSEEPKAPGLLLVDRFALLDERRRELVRAFDRRNPSWISLMEPWNADDPECQAADGNVHTAAEEALRHQRRELRPSLRGGHEGLPSLESFEAELPRAAQRAIYGFSDYDKSTVPGKSTTLLTRDTGSVRPTLRAAPSPSPEPYTVRSNGSAPYRGAWLGDPGSTETGSSETAGPEGLAP